MFTPKLEQHPKDMAPPPPRHRKWRKENYSLREIIRLHWRSTGLKHPGSRDQILKRNGKIGTRGNGKWTTDNTCPTF